MNPKNKHELKIDSLHDGMAHCTAGDWWLTNTGKTTRKEIEYDYRKYHIVYESKLLVKK